MEDKNINQNINDNINDNHNSLVTNEDKSSNIFTISKNTISTLLDKYKNNNYILQRIDKHINNYLPKILENEYNNYEKRLSRNKYLLEEQKIFIQIFLSKNKYFYLL